MAATQKSDTTILPARLTQRRSLYTIQTYPDGATMEATKASTESAEPQVQDLRQSSTPEGVGASDTRTLDTGSYDTWAKVRELAVGQLDRLIACEPKVLRGDDPEAIHDMRVASRRLQQALDLLYPKPRARRIRRLRRRLRRCRSALGEVRNCDVLIRRVAKVASRTRSARRETWKAVKHYLLERRAQSFEISLGKLSKLNLAVVYVRLKQHLTAPLDQEEKEELPPAHPQGFVTLVKAPTKESFPERASRELERLWTELDEQVAVSHRDPRPAVIHGVRVAAKRFRYLVEVISEFGVPGSSEALEWLRQIQQHLGEWHDRQILEQMTIEMVARPQFLRGQLDLAISVARLIVENRRGNKELEEDYLRMTQESAGFNQMKEWANYVLGSPSEAFRRI